MCHVFDKETLLNMEAEVKGAENYPKPPAQKLDIGTKSSPTISQVHVKLSPLERQINQVFEGIGVSTKRLHEYYLSQGSELAKLQESDPEVAKLDSEISDQETRYKEKPTNTRLALIEELKQEREAITAKTKENLGTFLARLRNFARAFPEPQEMDNMTEVVVKK